MLNMRDLQVRRLVLDGDIVPHIFSNHKAHYFVWAAVETSVWTETW